MRNRLLGNVVWAVLATVVFLLGWYVSTLDESGQREGELRSTRTSSGEDVSEGVRPENATVERRSASEEHEDVPAPSSVRAFGTVTRVTGEPLAGVAVSLLDRANFGLERMHALAILDAQTDAQGRFSFPVEDSGRALSLWVRKDGFKSVGVEEVPIGAEQRIDLQAAATVFGIVRDGDTGSVVPRASIECEGERCTSDREGSYEMAVPVGSKAWLHVTCSGYHVLSQEVASIESDRSRLDLTLIPERDLPCIVVDASTGAALAGVEVQLGGRVATSDEAGRVDVRSMDGTWYQARLSFPGYVDLVWSTRRTRDASSEPVRVPMLRGARVDGVVQDTLGGPIGGVEFTVEGPSERTADEEFARWSTPGTGRYAMSLRVHRAKTESRGTFVLDGLCPSESVYVVTAMHDEFLIVRSPELSLRVPGATATLNLSMIRGARLSGAVSYQGEPLEYGQFLWRGPTREGEGVIFQGTYHCLAIEPGEVTFHVRSLLVDRPVEPMALTLKAGENRKHDFAFRAVPEERRLIMGRVLRADLEPVGQFVELVVRGTATADDGARIEKRAMSDEQGGFAIEVPANDVYALTAFEGLPKAIVRTGVQPGATDVQLVLPAMGRLRLELAQADGEPLRGADAEGRRLPFASWVFHRLRGDGVFRRLRVADVPDVRGRIDLELLPGSCDLVVDGRPWGCGMVRLEGLSVTVGGTTVVPVRFAAAFDVRLTLRYESLDDRACFLLREDQLSLASGNDALPHTDDEPDQVASTVLSTHMLVQQRIRPGSDGSARLRCLAPGRYRFVSVPSGLRFEPAFLDVQADVNVAVGVERAR
ncbi:MAG: carboxypeptidase regulatory-like domain-containing protein [Planctomycetes bacterium]|nr:carboxypeptidase regulatory-like domain-containing protein [Planctomycetota bacterium]